MQVTITLDSGAFFDELKTAARSHSQLEVGYFISGPGVSDIQVMADGNPVSESKLTSGIIEVRHKKSNGDPVELIEITEALAKKLLKKSDIYPTNTPGFYKDRFDCLLNFTSGRFCCSMVKERRFVEYDLTVYNKTGHDRTMRPVAHNVAVYFDLADGDFFELRMKDAKDPIFSTKDLPAGKKRVDIDIVADNTTAEKLFRHALDLSTHIRCWLPNQGDPPTLGSP